LNSKTSTRKPPGKTVKAAAVKSAARTKTTSPTVRSTRREEGSPGLASRGHSLIIVESPTKARTLSRYLGAPFVVMASGGHVRDLPDRELGVDIAHGFEPDYHVLAGKQKIVTALTAAAEKAGRILIATDPDREGEAIGWHIAQLIRGKRNQTMSRVQFHEITKHAVEEAIASPGEIDIAKVEAQQARRIMDRLVGYQVSPLLWRTVTKGTSAGRVQSVALRLICEREAEIDAFVTQEFWTIDGRFATESSDPFIARLIKLAGKKFESSDETTSKKTVAFLKGLSYRITDIKRTTRKRQPPPPYITSTLQQDGARRLGFPVKRTMSIAQKLYEGIEVGERGQIGLITYMRTDSLRIAPEANTALRGWIAETYGVETVAPNARFYKNKKGPVQDAHEAIRPSDVRLTPELVKNYLSPEEYKLYDMIWRRFVATQMREAEFDVTMVTITSGTHAEFRANGQVITQLGFLILYESQAKGKKTAVVKSEEGDNTEKDKEDEEGDLVTLPKNLTVGMPVNLLALDSKQHFTEPPPRFSEASLVKELDEKGIGRPSTYATIISTLLDRTYVDKIEKALHPTDLGKTVNRVLVDRFPNVFSVEFTALMEEELDKIEEGAAWRTVLNDFYIPFKEALDTAEGMRQELRKESAQQVGRKCPDCGRELIYRFGKKGKFISCSGFPECKFAENIGGEAPVETDVKCPKCGKPMLKRTGRFGPFLGCSGYPTCKTILPIKTNHACPESGCTGHLTERRTKTGKTFYGCSRYPDCQFVSWDAPTEGDCPSCKVPTTFKKGGRSGGLRYCSKCNWKEKESA